jgi:hypothetical protein
LFGITAALITDPRAMPSRRLKSLFSVDLGPKRQGYKMEEYHRARRVRAGQIVLEGSAQRCKVRYLTAKGAMITAIDPIAIPENFDLRIQSEGLALRCRVVWRDSKRLGVAFSASLNSSNPVTMQTTV